MYQQSAGQKLQ